MRRIFGWWPLTWVQSGLPLQNSRLPLDAESAGKRAPKGGERRHLKSVPCAPALAPDGNIDQTRVLKEMKSIHDGLLNRSKLEERINLLGDAVLS